MHAMSRATVQALAALVLAFPILACGGGSAAACLGWVQDDQGQRHSPQSGVEDRTQAQRNACSVYCVDTDPTADAMYQAWLASPQGNPNTTRFAAMASDPAMLAAITACENTCVADVGAGRRQGGVDCDE